MAHIDRVALEFRAPCIASVPKLERIDATSLTCAGSFPIIARDARSMIDTRQ